MKKILLIAALFLGSSAYAGEQSLGPPWSGLNNSDASFLIGDNEAQDLLNVDFTDTAYGIKKRPGYSQFRTIGTSTWGVRGGYYFRDAGGIDEIVAANNQSVYKSTNSLAFASFITTDTAGSYYDFTDSNGSLWRATNNRDEICKYDGTTRTYYPSTPKGDQIEALPDRLAITGTTANPNRIHKSAVADFTDFATGNENSSAYTVDVGLPGSRITAMKWFGNKLLFWTKSTLGYEPSVDQFDLTPIGSISNTVGTLQPYSVVEDLGVVYFQGNDNHFYATDGNSIDKISSKLDVSDFANSVANTRSWEQTTQADWAAGATSPNLALDTTTAPGDIQFSTNGALYDDFSDGDFTAAPAWNLTIASMAATASISAGAFNFSVSASSGPSGIGKLYASTVTPNTAQFVVFDYKPITDSASAYSGTVIFSTSSSTVPPDGFGIQLAPDDSPTANRFIKVINGANSSTYAEFTQTFTPGTTYAVKLIFIADGSAAIYVDNVLLAQTTLTDLAGLTFKSLHFGVPSPVVLASFETSYDNIRVSTGTATFQSQSFNVGTAITSWGAISINQTLGGGSLAYAIYGDTDTSFSPSTVASFSSSQTITNGSIPTIATAAYVAVLSTFTRTTSTQTPTLNDFTVSWNEGTSIFSHAFVDDEHRIGWTVAEGTSTVPDKTYIYDQRFDSWLKYDFPLAAPIKVGDSIYFGGVSTGVVYQFPSGNTDDGAAITSYWKSKNFTSGSPFTEKTYNSISMLAKTQTGSNLDITYTVNTTSAVLRNISLTDADGASFIRNNENIVSGQVGTFFNIKFGNDDGDAPFEVYSVKYDYDPLPWSVKP